MPSPMPRRASKASNATRLNKRKQTEKKEAAQHLSSPRHSHSILWGHTGRHTLSADESTTQWIDGSAHEDYKQNSGSVSGMNGVLKTPKKKSTKKALLTPQGKTPKSIEKKQKKSSTKKMLSKKRNSSPSTSTSPTRHNHNDLNHLGKSNGQGTSVSATNLRWAYNLRTSEKSPSVTLGTNPSRRVASAALDAGIPVNSLDNAFQSLTKKLDAVSGKTTGPLLKSFYQNAFHRIRSLEEKNFHLQTKESVTSSQLSTLKSLLGEERSKVSMLQIEIDKVTHAANALRRVMADESFLEDNEKEENHPDGESQHIDVKHAMFTEHSSWMVEGIREMFSTFDHDKDGWLNVREMNTLQVALGNIERYSLESLTLLCTENGIEISTQKGIPLKGLLTLYSKLGPEATSRDLTKLGITAGPLLYPRRALEHATNRLVKARRHLEDSKHGHSQLKDALAKERTLSTHLKEELARYSNQYESGMVEVEDIRSRYSHAVNEAMTERAGRLYAENRLRETEEELDKARNACKDMHNLLKLKINEKEGYQRALWSVEQKSQAMNLMHRSARESEFKERRKQEELTKTNMMLHTKTIQERALLKQEKQKVRQLIEEAKPKFQAFGQTWRRSHTGNGGGAL